MWPNPMSFYHKMNLSYTYTCISRLCYALYSFATVFCTPADSSELQTMLHEFCVKVLAVTVNSKQYGANNKV